MKNCEHDFKYSHTESPGGTYSSVPPDVDVMVCRKCGLLIRQTK